MTNITKVKGNTGAFSMALLFGITFCWQKKSKGSESPGFHEPAKKIGHLIYPTMVLLFYPAIVLSQEPRIELQKSFWNPMSFDGPHMYISQDLSGEDWFYSVSGTTDPTNQANGYVMGGYSTIPNFFVSPNTLRSVSHECRLTQASVPDPTEFEGSGHLKGTRFAKLVALDARGNVRFYRPYELGRTFYASIQTSDGGFIAVGDSLEAGEDIEYNPQPNQPKGSALKCDANKNISHVYVVKTKKDGTPEWQFIYGMVDDDSELVGNELFNSAYELDGIAYSVVQHPINGNYIIAGYVRDPNDIMDSTRFGRSALRKGFLLEVNQAGQIVQKKMLSTDGQDLWIRALIQNNPGAKDETTYYVSGQLAEGPVDFPAHRAQAVVIELSTSFGISAMQWIANPPFTQLDPDFSSHLSSLFVTDLQFIDSLNQGVVPTQLRQQFDATILFPEDSGRPLPLSDDVTVSVREPDLEWLIEDDLNNVVYLIRKSGIELVVNALNNSGVSFDLTIDIIGRLLLPVIVNCSNCVGAENGHGIGLANVYRLDPEGLLLLGEPIDFGIVKGFDLQFGITATQGGGFAVVSTKQEERLDDNSFPTCPFLDCFYSKEFWNSKAYIAKADKNGNIEWERLIETHEPPGLFTGLASTQGDIKSQECLYKMVETPGGSLVAVGNNSHNFDDDYLIQLGFINADIDGDGDVDRMDVAMIMAARGTVAEPKDRRDLDRDGRITVLDARKAVLLCDRPGCVTE